MTREDIEKNMHEAAEEIKPLITTLVEALCDAHQKGYLAGVELGAKIAYPHWIPVEEGLPAIAFDTGSTWDCSDDVYIYLATGTYCVGRFEHDKLRNEFYWVLYGIDKDIPVTHWMPLPEAPRKE